LRGVEVFLKSDDEKKFLVEVESRLLVAELQSNMSMLSRVVEEDARYIHAFH
jgi:hypothetical protein